MNINKKALEVLKKISDEIGWELEIKKIWPDEDNPGFYCRFYGLLSQTKH